MAHSGKVQVLVIEDENTLKAIQQLQKQNSACEIKVVKTGEEAAEEMLRNQYDIILVDSNLLKEKAA